MGISSWTARAVVLCVGAAAGVVGITSPSSSSAAPPTIANGVLAVGGAALADPDANGVATTIGEGQKPAWSPDGTRMVTSWNFTSRDVFVTDLDGQKTALQAPETFERLNGVSWLDSDTLVMVSGNGTVWTMDDDGTEQTQVFDLSPRFDQDSFTYVRLERSRGDRLLIAYRTSVSFDELVLLDLGTDEVTTLVPEDDERYVDDAAFTPDGGTVTYVSEERLHNVPATGGASTALLPDLPVRAFDWSPDGGYLAYAPVGRQGVWVYEVESGNDHQATVSSFLDVAWQPVGSCTVTGTSGADALAGTAGDDVICAGDGDDVITASAGTDVVVGGLGSDRIDYSGSVEPVTYDGSRFVGRGVGRSELLSVEQVTGSALPDVLRGRWSNDVLDGGLGDDILSPGYLGEDSLEGGGGRDTLDLTATPGGLPENGFLAPLRIDLDAGTITDEFDRYGTDHLSSIEDVVAMPRAAEYIGGDDGPNLLESDDPSTVVEGRGGDDILRGGTVSYASAPGPVTVNLMTGVVSGSAGSDDVGDDVWAVVGSAHDDEITARTVDGGPGDDLIHGTSDDHLNVVGGDGDDTLDLGLLSDGADISSYHGDRIEVEEARLTRWSDSFDATSPGGTAQGMTINGLAGDDVMRLGAEPGPGMTIRGGAGDDRLFDGFGDNRLFGDSGNDVLWLGQGDDTARGGSGTDVLRFFLATGGVRVDLLAGTATGKYMGQDLVGHVEEVIGTRSHDVLLGSDGPDVLRAGQSFDRVQGRGGDDLIVVRDDYADTAYGGAGRDTCVRDSRDTVRSCT